MINNLTEYELYVNGQVDAFRLWLEERSRAENTILAYTFAVRQFYSLYRYPSSGNRNPIAV